MEGKPSILVCFWTGFRRELINIPHCPSHVKMTRMSVFTAIRTCHLLSGLEVDLVSNFKVHRNYELPGTYAAGNSCGCAHFSHANGNLHIQICLKHVKILVRQCQCKQQQNCDYSWTLTYQSCSEPSLSSCLFSILAGLENNHENVKWDLCVFLSCKKAKLCFPGLSNLPPHLKCCKEFSSLSCESLDLLLSITSSWGHGILCLPVPLSLDQAVSGWGFFVWSSWHNGTTAMANRL